MIVGSGPEWWLRFLRDRKVRNERAWWSIAGRESSFTPDCLYPAGAPWGDWKHGNGRHFDTGIIQLNDRHCETAAALGYGPDMRWALDPEKSLDYGLKHLSWLDWGLEIVTDAAGVSTGYRFRWDGWPAEWVATNAASAEAGFKHWWDAYPIWCAKVYGGVPKPVTPPKPVVPPKPVTPSVSLAQVQPGRRNDAVLRVQKALADAVGLDYSSAPGLFGPRTKAAYAKWQRSVGFAGKAADGVPGLVSLRRLGDRYGFKVIP